MGTGSTILANVSSVTNTHNDRRALIVNVDDSQSSFSAVYTANQTNLTIITPSSGKHICVHGVYCATESAAGEVQVDFATSSKPVFRMYATKTSTQAASTMNVTGADDEVLTLTTTTGANDLFLLVNYMEEE